MEVVEEEAAGDPVKTFSLLLQPGGLVGPRRPQLYVELLQRLLQLLLVASKVRRDGVVEEEELLMHHLHLMERNKGSLGKWIYAHHHKDNTPSKSYI